MLHAQRYSKTLRNQVESIVSKVFSLDTNLLVEKSRIRAINCDKGVNIFLP